MLTDIASKLSWAQVKQYSQVSNAQAMLSIVRLEKLLRIFFAKYVILGNYKLMLRKARPNFFSNL